MPTKKPWYKNISYTRATPREKLFLAVVGAILTIQTIRSGLLSEIMRDLKIPRYVEGVFDLVSQIMQWTIALAIVIGICILAIVLLTRLFRRT